MIIIVSGLVPALDIEIIRKIILKLMIIVTL